MRTPSIVAILLSLFVAVVCGRPSGVEQRQNLGFGFHRDIIAEGGSWEVGHFEYLFLRSRKLSQIDECAVSPSGKAVVYQDRAVWQNLPVPTRGWKDYPACPQVSWLGR